jgi:hypothetical protein
VAGRGGLGFWGTVGATLFGLAIVGVCTILFVDWPTWWKNTAPSWVASMSSAGSAVSALNVPLWTVVLTVLAIAAVVWLARNSQVRSWISRVPLVPAANLREATEKIKTLEEQVDAANRDHVATRAELAKTKAELLALQRNPPTFGSVQLQGGRKADFDAIEREQDEVGILTLKAFALADGEWLTSFDISRGCRISRLAADQALEHLKSKGLLKDVHGVSGHQFQLTPLGRDFVLSKKWTKR